MSDVSRKNFIEALGIASATVALPEAAEASTSDSVQVAQAHAHPSHASPAPAKAPATTLGSEPEAYTFLTQPEWQFVEAAVERLIPTDASGPGAREAGVAYYIDQQLAGAYGLAAKMYRQGPWNPEAAPEYGYQLPLTPQEVYRLGIAATNAHCQKTFGKTFDALSAAHQDQVLTQVEGGKIAFDALPAATFFQMLYANTVEGFFARSAVRRQPQHDRMEVSSAFR